ncbi:50S ribosomal protein L28 [Candidatus Peribacteria bacterium]|nr:50S ribosomal protein L28 [Candidatus Peribacteria bacterium]
MARRCALTGKAPKAGNNKPFSLKRTKRVFRPNLFKVRVFNPLSGRTERVTLSAKAIRTLKKWDREAEALLQEEVAALEAAAAPTA